MSLSRYLSLSLLLLSLLFLPSQPAPLQQHPRPIGQTQVGSALVYVTPGNISDLTKTSGTETFDVNVSASPAPIAFQSFLVMLDYNTTMFTVNNIDYTGNVLGSQARVFEFCIDATQEQGSLPCMYEGINTETKGVITLALYLQGNQSSLAPISSGLLFHVTFNVIGTGFGQIHIFSAQLVSTALSPVSSSTEDGYFTNLDCPSGSGVPCRSLNASFSVLPLKPIFNVPASFTASVVDPNSGGVIESYSWDWGDGTLPQVQTNLAQPIDHTFFISIDSGRGSCVGGGNCTVTLTVSDSYGISWKVSQTVQVVMPLPQPDFTIDANSTSLRDGFVISGRSISGQIHVVSVGGFAGEVNLTVAVSYQFGSPNVTATLSLRTLSVPNGGKNSTLLQVSAGKNSVAGAVNVVVTGRGTTQVHSMSIEIFVVRPKVELSCDPWALGDCGPFLVAPGGNVSFPLFLFSQNGFNGTVYLQAFSPEGVTVSFSPSSVVMAANGTSFAKATISTTAQTQVGGFDLELMATSPEGSASPLLLFLTAETAPFLPDFSINMPPSITVRAGQNATLQASISSLNGFKGSVEFFAGPVPLFPPSGLTASTNRTNLFGTFFALGANQTIFTNVLLSAGPLVVPGNYTVAADVGGRLVIPSQGLLPADRVAITMVRVLPPADAPAFIQFHWKHTLSHPIHAGFFSQDFVFGVHNPNNSTILYLDVSITGVSPSGGATFTIDSGLLRLLPGQTITNIRLTQTFPLQETGLTFTFNTTIHWGTNQDSLSQSNSSSDIPTGGNFVLR